MWNEIMNGYRSLLILIVFFVLVSLACNAFTGEPLESALPRPDVAGDDNAVDGDDATQLPPPVIQNLAPTATIAGELTLAPPTAVAEPVDGEPLLTALVDVNIRLGPGVAYARDGFLLAGETAVVLGRHAESGWWKIVCPVRADGNVCWVSGGSQYTSVSHGSAAQPVAAPPTPTAAPTVAITAVATAVSESSSSVVERVEAEAVSEAVTFSMVVSGARMVYADADAVWLLPLDEAAAEPIWLADAENVTDLLISPNGRYAAYVLADDLDMTLYLTDIETGAVQTCLALDAILKEGATAESAVQIGHMQWLADSETVAFNTTLINRADDLGVGRQQDLWTVDVTGALTERFSTGEGGGTFAISEDNVVLLGQETAVVRANLDGRNRETLIEFDFVNTASEAPFYPWLQWVAGEAFAMVAISSPEPLDMAQAYLWRVPASGQAKPMGTIAGNIVRMPIVWSDAGNQLGYVQMAAGADETLVIGAGEGTTAASYAENVLRFFGWNPAAAHFVYAGQGYYAVGQPGADPLVVDVSEGRTAVAAQWLNDNEFIIALGSSGSWDFRQQTIDGPATRLISGATTPIFDIWTP